MSAWVVVDASVILATVLPEPLTLQAKAVVRQLVEADTSLAAPILFRYELVSVLRKSVARGVITPAEGSEKRDLLLSQAVTLMFDDDLLRRAYDLATRYNRPTVYDAQYLAVAERLGCDFWTADERLFNALRGHLAWVRWLGQPAPPTP